MCFGSKPKPQPAPIVQPAPRRDEAQQAATSERRRLSNQQGVYGNIFTSVLGDPTYNANASRQTSATASLGA